MPNRSPRRGPPATRYADIDGAKALAALGVVAVHCMRPHWDPQVTRFELWFGSAFATLVTPVFLFCAGFLAADSSPLPTATVARRLRRLLLPYVIATALAELYRAFYLGDPGEPLLDLLLARAFGPYYFVFHMALLIPLSLGLSRMRASHRAALWMALLATGAVRSIDTWRLGLEPDWAFTWLVRNPFIYWGFFLSGWQYRLGRQTLAPWLVRHRPALAALCLVVIGWAWLEASQLPPGQTPALSYPLIYANVVLCLLLPWPGPTWLAAASRWLSDRTYSVYLFHLFFVTTAMRLLPQPPSAFEPGRFAVHYLAGLLGVAALVALRDAIWRPK